MKIGIDLGGTNIRAGLIKDENIIKMNAVHLENKDDLDSTLEQLKQAIRPVFEPGIRGIGIGVPSVVDVEKGIVYDVVNIPSWKEVPLKEILEKEFGVPVHVNNDLNCFVLGEKYFGFGKNHKTIVGVAMGTGIGSGIIIDNKLYSGVNCGAGEIGYLPYLDHDLEYYCSSGFFVKEHGTTAHRAFLDAEKNAPKAMEIWKEFGHHMGIALKSVMYAFDPEAIVLGGSISNAFGYFKDQMFETMKDTWFPKSVEKLKVYVSNTEHVTMLGASTLVDQYEEFHIG